MKHIKSILLKSPAVIVMGVMVFIASAFTLPSEEPCMVLLRGMYNKMSQDHLKEEVLYINYSVKAVPFDTLNEAATGTIEVWMSKEQMHVKSDQMQVYQDKKDIFTVLPGKKLVYRSDAIPGPEKEKKAGKLALLQDTLFTMCRVVKCESNTAAGEQQVVLRTNEKARRLFNIHELRFSIDSGKQVLKRIRIDYHKKWDLPGSTDGLEYVEYTFNAFDYYPKEKKLNQPVASLVMKSGKKLAEPYAGYQLVDNRYKTNPIRYE